MHGSSVSLVGIGVPRRFSSGTQRKGSGMQVAVSWPLVELSLKQCALLINTEPALPTTPYSHGKSHGEFGGDSPWDSLAHYLSTVTCRTTLSSLCAGSAISETSANGQPMGISLFRSAEERRCAADLRQVKYEIVNYWISAWISNALASLAHSSTANRLFASSIESAKEERQF